MTDRELLELAAKAAGINALYWSDGSEPYSSGEGVIYSDNAIWNPLTCDGDALRLAVKLKIDTKHYPDHVVCWYEDFFGTGKIFYEDNPCAATRRAITLAAVEIGRALP